MRCTISQHGNNTLHRRLQLSSIMMSPSSPHRGQSHSTADFVIREPLNGSGYVHHYMVNYTNGYVRMECLHERVMLNNTGNENRKTDARNFRLRRTSMKQTSEQMGPLMHIDKTSEAKCRMDKKKRDARVRRRTITYIGCRNYIQIAKNKVKRIYVYIQ